MSQDHERLARIEEKVDGIVDRLNKINGSVGRHSEWIAGQTQICGLHASQLVQLQSDARAHQTYIDQQKGGFRATAIIASVIGSIVGLAVGLLGLLGTNAVRLAAGR